MIESTSPTTVRVLVVDDHAGFRRALVSTLSLVNGLEVVGEASDGEAGFEAAFQTAPDVVVMDSARKEFASTTSPPMRRRLDTVTRSLSPPWLFFTASVRTASTVSPFCATHGRSPTLKPT